MSSESSSFGFSGVLRDIRSAVVEMFGGNKLPEDQQVAVEVLFGLIGVVAKSDRLVTDHEANLANQLMDELELPNHGRSIASAAFERGFRRQIDPEAEAARLRENLPPGSTELANLLDTLVRVALIDGRLFPGERDMLEKIAVALGFDAAAVQRRLATAGVA